MNNLTPIQKTHSLPPPPNPNDKIFVLVIYGLFLLSIFSSNLFAIVGIIIAYIKRDSMQDTIYYNHLTFQIKTFWIVCLAYLLLALLLITLFNQSLTLALISIFTIWGGFGILAILSTLISIWAIYRCIVGIVKAVDQKTINPNGFFH